MDESSEIGVLELGMNHAGEIRALAAMARPEIGVVTNVNAVHLEFFRSVDEIALAKRELVEELPGDGIAVLNEDDERVREFGRAFSGRVVRYGVDAQAEVRAVDIENRGLDGTRFRLEGFDAEFWTPLAGRHNLYNTLAGIACGCALGIEPASLVDAVARLRPAGMRGEAVDIGGIRIINDCYNSNPRAVEVMLELLAATPANRRIVVLGEMLELGPEGPQLHRRAGEKVAGAGVNLLVGVQGAAKELVDGAVQHGLPESAARFFSHAAAAGEYLRQILRPGDVVLFKASRGVRLEEALDAVRSKFVLLDDAAVEKGVEA
jgi:UDP-N-acetylmuramoyl-tripeptide--D-alanyl-D-alanine ligase